MRTTLSPSICSLALLLCIAPACGGDSDEMQNESGVVIQEVTLGGANPTIEIKNLGDETIDLSGYFLCDQPAYVRLNSSSLTIESGSLNLATGQSLVVSGFPAFAEAGAELGLYKNDSFASSDAIASYVTWGDNPLPNRESVAVDADLWTTGESIDISGFVPGDAIRYDGSGITAADWTKEPVDSTLNVVINEVKYADGTDLVELRNNGATTVDVSTFQLCTGTGPSYQALSSLTKVAGELNMAPGALLVVEYTLPNADSGVALYVDGSDFENSANMLDFVQYGAKDSVREPLAVAAGLWIDDEFVPTVNNNTNSIQRSNNGGSAGNWVEAAPTLGADN